MSGSHAHAYSVAPPAPSYSSDEPASSPRLRCPPPIYETTDRLSSEPEVRSVECPRFTVEALTGDVLKLTIPGQSLPENRGFISPHFVLGRLRDNKSYEVELYSISRRRLQRRYQQRAIFITVGVWSIGEYVFWRGERALDFLVLDAVDSCLRKQLPPGGGVLTLKRLDVLASAAGVSFRA